MSGTSVQTRRIDELAEATTSEDEDLLIIHKADGTGTRNIKKKNLLPAGGNPSSGSTENESPELAGIVHNGIYRGKVLPAFSNDMYETIKSGTFKDMYIGDKVTAFGYEWQIAHFDYFGVSASLGHHVVLVCVDSKRSSSYEESKNASRYTGYTGSYLEQNIKAMFSGMQTTHGAGRYCKKTKIYVDTAMTTNGGNHYRVGQNLVESEIFPLNVPMVFGVKAPFGMQEDGRMDCRGQLALFRLNPSLWHEAQAYWLENVQNNAAAWAVAEGRIKPLMRTDSCKLKPFIVIG